MGFNSAFKGLTAGGQLKRPSHSKPTAPPVLIVRVDGEDKRFLEDVDKPLLYGTASLPQKH